MYTSTIISDKELDLLKSMIGKAFDKYRCDPFISSPMVYGIIGIYIDGKPVKITSLLQNVRRFMETDEVAVLHIEETSEESIKTFMDNGEMIDTVINSKIKSIYVVNDFMSIKYEGKIYKFSSTVGIIFKQEDLNEISFEIGTWFSKMITIQKGYNLIEKFTPVDDFIDEWEEWAEYNPSCSREIIELK